MSHVDALDMSWVRFKRTLASLRTIFRVRNSKPITDEEEISEDRESREPTV